MNLASLQKCMVYSFFTVFPNVFFSSPEMGDQNDQIDS